MTEDQIVLLRDKVEVWTRQAERGPPDFRDYNQRAADALASLLRRANELEGEVSTLRLQQQTDRQTIARLASANPAESGASGTDGQGPLSVARSARDEHIPPPNPVSHEGEA